MESNFHHSTGFKCRDTVSINYAKKTTKWKRRSDNYFEDMSDDEKAINNKIWKVMSKESAFEEVT